MEGVTIVIGILAFMSLGIVILAGQLETLYRRKHPPDDGTREERFDEDDDPDNQYTR